ncbi:MAG: YdcF family protein [Candidatus Riflebacteria bacterium]|nr:YdcF family protein [Candidatus Riflebacteria bacterium]
MKKKFFFVSLFCFGLAIFGSAQTIKNQVNFQEFFGNQKLRIPENIVLSNPDYQKNPIDISSPTIDQQNIDQQNIDQQNIDQQKIQKVLAEGEGSEASSVFENNTPVEDLLSEPDTPLSIPSSTSIATALAALQNCRTALTLFVTGENNELVGSLSDDDIRGWLINIANASPTVLPDIHKTKVTAVMHKNPVIIRLNQDSWVEKISEAWKIEPDRKCGIRLIPIVDKSGKLIDVLDLISTKRRSPLDVILMALAGVGGKYLPCVTSRSLGIRRNDYNENRIQVQIHKYEALSHLDPREIEAVARLSNGDEFYTALVRGMEWVKNLHIPNHEVQKTLVKLAIDLEAAKHRLLLSYISTYELGASVGSEIAALSPDLLFVLGCGNENELAERVKTAKNLAKKIKMVERNRLRAIIFSGSGTNPYSTEAKRMNDYFDFNDVFPENSPNRPQLILEEDSLDTVGNAIFSKLLLLRSPNLLKSGSRNLRICIVTSDYHARRTLDLFRRVFDKSDVAVVMARTSGDLSSKINLATQQLDSEFKANVQTFALENVVTGLPDRLATGNACCAFFQMLRHHPYYQHRPDLIRKYQDILGVKEFLGSGSEDSVPNY